MKKTILLSEQDLLSLIKKIITGHYDKKNNVSDKYSDLKGEVPIDELKDKTVRFSETTAEFLEPSQTRIYKIHNPLYKTVDGGNSIFTVITFELEEINRSEISKKLYPNKRERVTIGKRSFDDQGNLLLKYRVYAGTKSFTKLLENKKFEDFIKSLLKKYPFINVTKEIDTDF